MDGPHVHRDADAVVTPSEAAQCGVVPESQPLVIVGSVKCELPPGHEGWHEMACGERWLDPPAGEDL